MSLPPNSRNNRLKRHLKGNDKFGSKKSKTDNNENTDKVTISNYNSIISAGGLPDLSIDCEEIPKPTPFRPNAWDKSCYYATKNVEDKKSLKESMEANRMEIESALRNPLGSLVNMPLGANVQPTSAANRAVDAEHILLESNGGAAWSDEIVGKESESNVKPKEIGGKNTDIDSKSENAIKSVDNPKLGNCNESEDDSHTSYSPISFGNSDDNLGSNDMPIVNNDAPVSTVNSTTQRRDSKRNQRTKTSSKQKSSRRNQMCAQEPLLFIAEAMQAIDSSFPASKQKETAEKCQPSKRYRKKKSKGRRKFTKKSQTDNYEDSSSASSSTENSSTSESDQREASRTKNSRLSSIKKDKTISAEVAVYSQGSGNNSDTDDSNWRQKTKLKAEVIHSRDFYEDDSTFEDDKHNSEDDEEDQRIIAALPSTNAFNEYEQIFHEIYKLIEMTPNRSKYQIYSFLYPMLAMGYLRLIASGKYRKGKAFVDSCLSFIDHSYTARVDKLMVLQNSSDLPRKARKLLIDENVQIPVYLYEDTYELLLSHMQSWTREMQITFMKHFDLIPDGLRVPREHVPIGSGTLDKLYWATFETIAEKKETSPRPNRRKRFKKFKPSPNRNLNLPTGNRLYTPTPKRFDLERLKDDEERRVSLSQESLPSAYLYTALECVHMVICATFSNKSTMLCIGTKESSIHIYSLSSSMLVQLKAANSLKRLDTGMSGIDESMLDEDRKRTRRILYGHMGPVYGCSFAPQDRFLLSCSGDRTVRCWCLLSWCCVVIYPGHSGAIFGVTYAPLGYYFATCSDDRTARIWTQDSKKSVCILIGHLAEVVCCMFHPNRHYLATGSADCTVRLWDIIKAVQVRIFIAHREAVSTLSFSICGRYLVSGADDNFIIVWDTEKEQLIRILGHHTGNITCIEFALDNHLFVAGGQDCRMSVWNFERLIQKYDKEKQSDPRNRRSRLSTHDFLITSYASRDTPFCRLRITHRNLLLGFCVQRTKFPITNTMDKRERDADFAEWLELLDILKLKACYASKKYQELQSIEDSKDEFTDSSDDEDESD